jgi:hypothetical protein
MSRLCRHFVGVIIVLLGVGLLSAADGALASASRVVANARGVPANLCKLNLASQVTAVPFMHNVVTSCSTSTYTSAASQGGRTEIATYGNPDFTVTVISHYSASFLAQIEQQYGSGGKVHHLGVWARETSSALGVQLEAHGGKVIVYVSVNGHGVTMYPKFKQLDKPLASVGRAVLAQA